MKTIAPLSEQEVVDLLPWRLRTRMWWRSWTVRVGRLDRKLSLYEPRVYGIRHIRLLGGHNLSCSAGRFGAFVAWYRE